MRNTRKSIRFGLSAFCIALVLIFSAAAPICAMDIPTSSIPFYSALGDSIAYGYGLPERENEAYAFLLGNTLSAETHNLGVNGMTSQGLLDALRQGTLAEITETPDAMEAIAKSQLITLSIGSNDLLGPFMTALMQQTGNIILNGGPLNLEKILLILQTVLNDSSVLLQFETAVEQYGTSLGEIIDHLQTVSPQAEIVITELYNPYVGIVIQEFDFGSITDGYICRMNEVLHRVAKEKNCLVAPVYLPMNQPGMSNVSLSLMQFDPHPSIKGHAAFAQAIADILGVDVSAPAQGEEETSASSESESTVPTGEIPPEETPTTSSDDPVQNGTRIIQSFWLWLILFAILAAVIWLIIWSKSRSK